MDKFQCKDITAVMADFDQLKEILREKEERLKEEQERHRDTQEVKESLETELKESNKKIQQLMNESSSRIEVVNSEEAIQPVLAFSALSSSETGDVGRMTLGRSESRATTVHESLTVLTPRMSLEDVCKELQLDNHDVQHVEELMQKAISDGLNDNLSSVKCLPTFVRHLPSGREQGTFLALSFGGEKIRVDLVRIEENSHQIPMKFKDFDVDKKIMAGPGEELFDFIANCLADSVLEWGLPKETLPLGFSFSFPCRQEGLCKGRLTKWTKGFQCDGVQGKDVVELLIQSLQKRPDVRIEVSNRYQSHPS